MSKSFAEIHITNEGFRTLGIYRLFFKAALTEVLKARADYEAEVKDWYENGDGRPPVWATDYRRYDGQAYQVNLGGRGYRFPRCIHGADLWVDHDIPCGYCEGGENVYDIARGIARDRWLRFLDRWEWLQAAPVDFRYQFPDEWDRMNLWVISLFPKPEEA